MIVKYVDNLIQLDKWNTKIPKIKISVMIVEAFVFDWLDYCDDHFVPGENLFQHCFNMYICYIVYLC